MKFPLACVAMGSLLACSACTRGGPAKEIIELVCVGETAVADESKRVDLGLISVVPPNGYKIAEAYRATHGGAGFTSTSRGLGIRNGYWSESSFANFDTGEPGTPDCEFTVDGIPMEVYSGGEPEGYDSGVTAVWVIVNYPDRPRDKMVMQSLASAEINHGDLAYARDFSRFVRSIRRGDAALYVRAPGEIQRRRDR